jgi:lipopolysaccharide/colanic/teichoic acid biosynthesis glycosyltransferase
MPTDHVHAAKTIVPAAYFGWKRGIDLVLVVLMLVPALPLMGLLVLLVRLTSRGPGIYSQIRVGKNGRKFTMYKIRSMRQDAEAGTGAVWARTRDPRVTLVGSILRKLHLDELPQLFNILKGEMSLVGPRPERPEFVQMLARKIPGYCHRLSVLPGVTGLAQVNLPPDTDLDSVRRKLVLDLEYVRRASLRMDLALILGTAARMGKKLGPILLRALGVYREVADAGNDRERAAAPAAAYHPIPLLEPAYPFACGLPVPLVMVQGGEASAINN